MPSVRVLHGHVRHRRHLAARKDILVHKGVVVPRPTASPAHGVNQHDAVILEQVVAFVEEGLVGIAANMLEHADRVDPVKLARDFPVVLISVLDVGVGVVLLGPRHLLSRQRCASDMHAILGCQIVSLGSESEAKLQTLHPRLQVQLLRNKIHFGLLGFVQSHVWSRIVAASILHGPAEHDLIELWRVQDIVGVSNVALSSFE
mmetsp:Transcript_9449/g.17514  ORF Transcript_9449/g.17514 Transcript_9449/m.17514 type:complete len:203 (+) Transcript_9449:346-954(+)